jgi:hypothetical protein
MQRAVAHEKRTPEKETASLPDLPSLVILDYLMQRQVGWLSE